MIEFNFQNKTKYQVNQKKLAVIAKKFANLFFPGKDVQVSLTVVLEKEIKDLNQKYFQKNQLTDVISIEGKAKTQPKSLGEIIICGKVVKRQAKEQKHSFQKEIEILFSHGLIHLFGQDHDTKKQSILWDKNLSKLER